MAQRVLIAYYSYTDQTRLAAEAMGEALEKHGWEVDIRDIELIDQRYAPGFPMKPFWRKLLGLLLPSLLGRVVEVRFSLDGLTDKHFDLICIGSPTWWLSPAIPVRSFLKTTEAHELISGKPFAVFVVCRAFWKRNARIVRKLGRRIGGRFLSARGFGFEGSRVRTTFSFLSYLKTGQNRQRVMGIKVHPFGLSDNRLEQARRFAEELAEMI